jgi:drug/metabolite transporter (DMT)-like permease
MLEKNPATTSTSTARPLDAAAILITVVLCLSWGVNQVAVKLAIPEIPPLIQSAVRSAVAAGIVALWARGRDLPLFKHDGTLVAGLIAGVLFATEFILIYRGLIFTTAARAVLFIYLAPFFVVIGSRWLLSGDSFRRGQWVGLLLSFSGIVIAFGIPTPAADPQQIIGDIMMVGAAGAWAATTLVIKASALNRVSAEKTLLYQLVVSAPLLAAAAALLGEHLSAVPSIVALGLLGYQIVWVVSVTFLAWFALIIRYSASRLSVFTFLTPLFGVAAGHFILGDPLTPAFALAAAMVAGGLVLVNWPR